MRTMKKLDREITRRNESRERIRRERKREMRRRAAVYAGREAGSRCYINPYSNSVVQL